MSKMYQVIDSIELPASDELAVWGSWLTELAEQNGVNAPTLTLLLHADDGVIWGHLSGSALKVSSAAFAQVFVALRASTLQQLRLFGDNGELLLWRTHTGFAGRVITAAADATVGHNNWFDETHLLWGERVGSAVDGFTLLQEGAQGLLHAPPGNGDTVGMRMRHYIQYDATGQASVCLSRIIDLSWSPSKEEN